MGSLFKGFLFRVSLRVLQGHDKGLAYKGLNHELEWDSKVQLSLSHGTQRRMSLLLRLDPHCIKHEA